MVLRILHAHAATPYAYPTDNLASRLLWLEYSYSSIAQMRNGWQCGLIEALCYYFRVHKTMKLIVGLKIFILR